MARSGTRKYDVSRGPVTGAAKEDHTSVASLRSDPEGLDPECSRCRSTRS